MTRDRRALVYGLSAVLLWSTVATAFKLALKELDVLQLVAYSVSCSALALFLILYWQGRVHLLREYARSTPGYFLIMGLVNPVLYYLILLQACALLPAQQAQAINYSWAITLALLAVPLLGHRPTGRDLLALLLGYSGVLIIATRGQVLQLRFDSLAGVGLALLSTVIWALYWLLSTRNRRDPIACLGLNFTVAAPIATVLGERIHPATLVGLALILPGVLLQQVQRPAAVVGGS